MVVHAISYFRKQAKRFHGLLLAKDADATQRFRLYFPDSPFSLMRAQHVIAKEAGFDGWKALIQAPELPLRLAALMDDIPLLSDFGIGTFNHWRLPPDQRKQKLLVDRERLRNSTDEIRKTMDWLGRSIAKTRTINRSHSSYGLKHDIEAHIGYITNGVFIAAAILAGYGYRIDPSSPNVEFAMSSRSINAIRARTGSD